MKSSPVPERVGVAHESSQMYSGEIAAVRIMQIGATVVQ